jgi:hypothetical protein
MMKSFFFLLIAFSTSAFANICDVDMVDNYTGRVIDRFREYDYDGTCREGLKECKKQIRLSGWYGRAECFVRSRVPTPEPTPDYGPDATRPLRLGEVVIFNNQFATISLVDRNELYSIQYNNDWRSAHHQIPRPYIAVTEGCLNNSYNTICAGHQVMTRDNQYATVVGLQYNKMVILRMNVGTNPLRSNVDPNTLVITR